jgi:hypothetical protein
MVIEFALDAADGVQAVFQLVALAHGALRPHLIIPEIRVFRRPVQLGQAARRGIDVKDASSAAELTA